MKKIQLLILLLLIVCFSGCSSAELDDYDFCLDEPDHADCIVNPLDNVITYTSNGLEIIALDPLDIYHDIVDLELDFIYLYTEHFGNSLTQQEINSLSRLLPKINTLLEDYDVNSIKTLGLNDFKTILEDIDIPVTTEDIFTFGLFKDIIVTMSDTIEIEKTVYLEYRLHRSLTLDEKRGLSLLQTHYENVNSDSIVFDLETGTIEELRTLIELNDTIPESSYLLMEEALLILQGILNE